MPVLRKDPVTSRWVIIAADRGSEPFHYAVDRSPIQEPAFCPFCYGSEDKTPYEVLSYREEGSTPNEAGWRVRVVPNKFPALRPEGHLNKRGHGIYDSMNAIGVHEIIVEHPDHEITFDRYSDGQVELILRAYQDRCREILQDERLKYALIFKNEGKAAGASRAHPHSQLIAVPVVPKRVAEEMHGSLEYFRWKERCVFCDVIRQELAANKRICAQNEFFVCLAPFASRFPFELQILPRRHASHFTSMGDAERSALAKLMRKSLSMLLSTLDHPPFNYIVHTAPSGGSPLDHYHWHIEIMPRLTRIAGFEWGTGFYVNPTPPEEAIARLLADAAKEGA